MQLGILISIFLPSIFWFRISVVSKAMDLLKSMLQKDPKKRISAKEALNHEAFNSILSKSPLIARGLFSTDLLVKQTELMKELYH